MLADLLLAALRLTTGDVVPRLREAAAGASASSMLENVARDRRWWVRARLRRALGLVREPSSLDGLLGALDEPHEEVRAAAVDALGRIGDPACAALPCWHGCLTSRGISAHGSWKRSGRWGHPSCRCCSPMRESRPSDTAMTVDILGVVGGSAATESVVEWTDATDPAVRAAALRAIGSIGPTIRSSSTRSAALTTRTPMCAGWPLAHWDAAAGSPPSRISLRTSMTNGSWRRNARPGCGVSGGRERRSLEARAASTGQGADLARQMLWELTFLKVGA